MIEGARCLALAVMDDAEFFSECLQMSPGQGIYLYTDGVTEAFNPDGDLFGEERLKAVLEKAQSRNAEAIVHAVLRGIQDFSKDTPQSDDITMLALKLPAR
jgi:sigma-B regulation protein RsbU (phosphoserine phosphatase)